MRDELTVTCWCERRFVAATPEEIRNGQTRSCGHERCEEGCTPAPPKVNRGRRR